MKLLPVATPAALAMVWFISSTAGAQNVTGYGSMQNPLLLLLREPAVHEELLLDPQQQRKLQELNDRLDGPLLALRNRPRDEADRMFAELVQQTHAGLEEILKDSQRRRLGEILLRVRGVRVVLTRTVAERLELSDRQRKTIEDIVADARDEVNVLAEELRSGKSPEIVQRRATLAREREQRGVLSELTDQQRRLLVEMVGRTFDLARLGRVRFKAPELAASGEWINSEPLRLANLRGQVVALHFWAFGCVNCQRNYPWYRQWQESLAPQGLTIIGVHTPETNAERSVDALRRKVKDAGFNFPVLADNEKENWNLWGNSVWPSVYLIDKNGYLRYWWYGELNWKDAGGQEIMKKRIEELLAEES